MLLISVVNFNALTRTLSRSLDAPKEVDPKDPKAIEFYQTKIQPLLAQSCLGCHGPERPRSGLRLDSREAILKGGKRGPAAVPGDPEKSLIVQAVAHQHPEVKMPPRRKLKDEQIADITEWVKLGVPFPEPAKEEPKDGAN